MKKILLFVLYFSTFFIQVEAFQLGYAKYILQNTDTGEIKYFDTSYGGEIGLVMLKFENFLNNKPDGTQIFEKWKILCSEKSFNTIEKEKKSCDYISESRINFNDLLLKDQIKFYLSISGWYVWLAFLSFPFNFFVFFGISYVLLGSKVSLKKHIIITLLLSLILDLTLGLFGLNFMQLIPVFFGIVIYFPFVFVPKSVFFFFGVYQYFRYKKHKKECNKK